MKWFRVSFFDFFRTKLKYSSCTLVWCKKNRKAIYGTTSFFYLKNHDFSSWVLKSFGKLGLRERESGYGRGEREREDTERERERRGVNFGFKLQVDPP